MILKIKVKIKNDFVNPIKNKMDKIPGDFKSNNLINNFSSDSRP